MCARVPSRFPIRRLSPILSAGGLAGTQTVAGRAGCAHIPTGQYYRENSLSPHPFTYVRACASIYQNYSFARAIESGGPYRSALSLSLSLPPSIKSEPGNYRCGGRRRGSSSRLTRRCVRGRWTGTNDCAYPEGEEISRRARLFRSLSLLCVYRRISPPAFSDR